MNATLSTVLSIATMLAMVGCKFEASTKVELDTGLGTVTDSATSDTSTTEPVDPETVDDDGDGYSEIDGDCDDENPEIAPGLNDGCNQIDDDCDDEVDEDAWAEDTNEPNDDEAIVLGDIGVDKSYSVSGILHNDDDVDKFRFNLEDDLNYFTITASLSNIPEDATYLLTLERIESDGSDPVGHVVQVFGSGTIELSFEDSFDFTDQGGTYEFWVEAIAGADCATTYLLSANYETAI